MNRDICEKTYFGPFHAFRNTYPEREILKKWLKHHADRGIKVCVTIEKHKSMPKEDGEGRFMENHECYVLWVNCSSHLDYAWRVANTLFPDSVLKQQLEMKLTREAMDLEGIEFRDFEPGDLFLSICEKLEANNAGIGYGDLQGSSDEGD